MPRRKSLERTTAINVRLPENMVAEVKLLLLDPSTGRVKYGAMNTLIEKLMRDWLEQFRAGDDVMPEEIKGDDDA